MKKDRNTNRGFSLIELIIVVAILAVLTALLAPQYFQYVEKSRKQVCYTNIATMTRMSVIARNLGADGYKELLEKTLEESYPAAAGKSGCPSGGVYEIKQNPTTKEWYINCSKHGAIPSLGNQVDMKKVLDTMEKTTKTNLDSGAMSIEGATSNVLPGILKELGLSLADMGAESWRYKKDSTKNILWWTDESIADKNVGDDVYVIQYRSDSGNYTVWKAKIEQKTQKFNNNEETYKVIGDSRVAYTPSTTDKEPQNYENALRPLKEAQGK